MRVFVAGAGGAIGLRLVPQPLERGYTVIGTSRLAKKGERLRALGAEAIVLDLLDARAVSAAVAAARPDAIIHEATALATHWDFRHFDRTFAQTNRLLAAACEVGIGRLVAQSYAMAYARQGGSIKTEADPLDLTPAPAMRETYAAIRHLEEAVVGVGGLAHGEAGVVLMTESRGAANAKAKHELGWALRHPSWRQGFVESYNDA